MPSSVHQTLLLWAARRMHADSFVVAGFDADADQGGQWNGLQKPFLVKGLRPDAWGASQDGALLAFAEAKTAGDIRNPHTLVQLRTFGRLRMKGTGTVCPLYVAVPRCEAGKLDKILIEAGLGVARHIVRLHVPEALLGGYRRAA